MGIINVLDQQTANLIAAGEVVERPASAVKELLENSIDAGAKKITVEVNNGGVSLMRVSDDGCGMSKDDAVICIQRHATSKVSEKKDLNGITTLGFRGEALAAISSVSEMRILTRTHGASTGIAVKSSAGKIVSVEEAGCPAGTTVIVEELFSNVPARKKFLKRDAMETAAISAVVEKIALSRPDISMRFIADGAPKFVTAGDGDLKGVIYAVLGKDFAKKLAKVEDLTGGIGVSGYIGTPENHRGNRNCENFFINGRYVKCQTASAALEQAFSSYIPSDRFPFCVLSITIHRAFVDVNVHPQKMEVKFSDEKAVFNAVYCAVRNTLISKLTRPEFPIKRENLRMTADSYQLYRDIMNAKTSSDDEAAAISDERSALDAKYEQIRLDSEARREINDTFPPEKLPYHPTESEMRKITGRPNIPDSEKMTVDEALAKGITGTALHEDMISGYVVTNPTKVITMPSKPGEEPKITTLEDALAEKKKYDEAISSEPKKAEAPWFRITGVAFNCYIFVELEGKMLVIDKHAAHERILFENLRANMNKPEPSSQLMMFPYHVQVTPEEHAAAFEYRDELVKLGYDFVEGNTPNTVALLQKPMSLNQTKSAEMFSDLVSGLASGTGSIGATRQKFYEEALYQASCKAAVKGGRDDSTDEDLRWIVTQVLTRDDVRYCPHGRPVAFEMTKSQFEKLFERT